ncbi:MAG: hypothetical protein AAGI70_09665 [Pseudomonadota bacterium]
MTRSPLTALPGERLPGIGHNQGPPLEPGRSFRRFAWKKARAALMPRLPLEVLRRRVARAKELGLAYPAYASILLGSGRDIVGFLFTAEAIGLRLQRGEIDAGAGLKLQSLTEVKRFLMTAAEQNPIAVGEVLARHRIEMAGMGPEPAQDADAFPAIRAILDPAKLPGDAVVMIGTAARERDWAEAARLAKFLPASAYFG